MRPPYWKIGALCFIAFVFITFGTVMAILWSSIFKDILTKELVFTPTSYSYEAWQKTPIPMYMEVYMFNWTNPEEFGKNLSSKPNFVEMGPYVFREIDYKFVRYWNDNGTITFRQKKNWIFQESLSGGLLDDVVTNLNPIVATIAYLLRNQNPAIKDLANLILSKKEKIIVSQPVRNLLFDGYEDPLFTLAEKYNIKIPFYKFGYFYGRNDSEAYDGVFNMKTGATSLNELGMIQEWNYSPVSQFYPAGCAEVKGSLGDFWPPSMINESISVFSPDICTSLTLEKSGVNSFQGMLGNEFTSSTDMFDNGTNVPSRKCYCIDSECHPSGTLNISSCRFGAPAFISLPHFYLADKTYISLVSGMKPDKNKHEFKVLIDQVSGIPLRARAGLQLNFLIQPDEYISMFKKVPKTFIPMLWFKQEANLTTDYASKARILTSLPTDGYVAVIFINIVGVALIVAAVVIFIRHRNKRDDLGPLLSEEDGELALPTET